METRTAHCPCGQLSATVTGDPVRVSVCHCLECKRRTGGAFSWNAHWEEAQVETAGESRSWTRTGEEGRWCTQHFCPVCGSTVWYRIEARPGIVSIPAGNFADPAFPEPAYSVYGERRCPWVVIETQGPLTEF